MSERPDLRSVLPELGSVLSKFRSDGPDLWSEGRE